MRRSRRGTVLLKRRDVRSVTEDQRCWFNTPTVIPQPDIDTASSPHTMSQQRKEVVWSIKKNLFRLSSAQLYEVARDLASGSQDIDQLSATDEEGCMDYVIAYMQSQDLQGQEDEGLSTLLRLNDITCKLLETELSAEITPNVAPSSSPTPTPLDLASRPPHPQFNRPDNIIPPDHTYSSSNPQFNDTIMQPRSHANPMNNAATQPGEELRRVYEELGKKLRLLEATSPVTVPNHHSEAVSAPLLQTPQERMVPLKDLQFLQRREFKVHGGQVGDQCSEISYNSISKQIDEGLKDGFLEPEVVRGVLRIIKPGTFKDMLSNKDELTVPELKVFLRSHLGQKATTEMFQELMCARQGEQESPQQFLYRMIGLKPRLLFQSKQVNTDISYDPKTILGGLHQHDLPGSGSETGRPSSETETTHL